MTFFVGYEHLIGGICGGVASTIICHPFDLLKIRYSANEGNKFRPQYSNYLHAIKSIIKTNGVKGLYQGLTPSIIGAPLSWGLYFHFFQKLRPHVEQFQYSFANNLITGTLTGGIVLALSNPFWVCKTQLCLQYENSVNQYRGFTHCLQRIFQTEGIRGLYRGFIPGLLGTANGAVQFAIYNYLKDWRSRYANKSHEEQLTTYDYLFSSIISKIAATVLTFPHQVLRVRLQDNHSNYKNLLDCIKKTVKYEGIKGLYKGMWMATIKQLPNSVVTYIVYEHTMHLLKTS